MNHPPPSSWWADSCLGQLAALRGPTSRRAAMLGLLITFLSACTSVPAASSAPTPRAEMPQLVEVIVQTERAVQILHTDGGIEVARAIGWPTLIVPIVVCVAFDGPRETPTTRTARLQDRSVCAQSSLAPD